jgi:hypothetical protein
MEVRGLLHCLQVVVVAAAVFVLHQMSCTEKHHLIPTVGSAWHKINIVVGSYIIQSGTIP